MPLQFDEALLAAIADRLLTLPDDTGHREPTTIGGENVLGDAVQVLELARGTGQLLA